MFLLTLLAALAAMWVVVFAAFDRVVDRAISSWIKRWFDGTR